jgi:outer membrane beta-barrel protein
MSGRWLACASVSALLLAFGVSATAIAAENDLFTGEQLINPEVERREIETVSIDTEDFEIGMFAGMYSTGDFGTNPVTGVRFAFHINEHLFVEFAGGSTKTEETSSEVFFPSAFPQISDRTLNYYNVSLGWNILPGESFVGDRWAFSSSYYFIAGGGNTRFADNTYFTVNVGMGLRFLITDWLAFHIDMRDHIFEHDVLVEDKTANNLEMHTGLTLFF